MATTFTTAARALSRASQRAWEYHVHGFTNCAVYRALALLVSQLITLKLSPGEVLPRVRALLALLLHHRAGGKGDLHPTV